MKNTKQQALFNKESGFTLVELAVAMGVIGILVAGSILGYQIYIRNANGNACTRQLGQLYQAQQTLSAMRNVSTSADWSSIVTSANIAPYLGNRTMNTTYNCPSAGTYAIGAWNATSVSGDKPTCTLGISGADATANQAARLHYLGAN